MYHFVTRLSINAKMGRKKVNCVYNYYETNETGSKCLICDKLIKGNHGTNLIKHLKCVHASTYQLVMKRNAALTEDESSGSPSASSTCKKFKSETGLLQECVKLTTVHGRPFALIDDQAFQNIIALIPGQKEQTVNSHKVKECVSESASEMRNDLSKEIKNQLFSLKVDAATLGTRCFLGINIQYGLDDKICVRNLGVIELYARHTSEYLAQNVIDNLNLYRLGIEQIYCCTTDNGANMLKMTKLLQEKLNSSSLDAIIDVNDENVNDEEDVVFIENENTIDPYIFQDDFDTALSSSIQHENFIIPTVRCAAHTLQLAVRDALKDEHTQNIIKSVRTLVKKLRTQNYAMFLKAGDKRKPFLDCSTRWGSTYDMLERFLDYKEVVSGEPSNDLFFPPENWLVVDNLLKSLKPSRVLTKLLQTEQLTMSDFYGHWLRCDLETSEMDTILSRKLSKHMKERQEVLFTNDAFISAIYLDPRYNAILSKEQQAAAREHLVRTYHRMILLEDENNITPVTPTATDQSESNDRNHTNDPLQQLSASDRLRNFITTKYLENRDPNTSQNTKSQTDKLKESLINFLNEPLLDHSENILSYWKSKKKSFPLLYQLSQIVLSAPATQVTVERLFSSLKFVLSNLRMSLKDSLVDDILFIRNNCNNK